MSGSGLSAARLGRLREMLGRHVDSGQVPGLVALVARRGEVHVVTLGTTEAGGAGRPMERDTIFRIASITKLIAAATAMTLVEEGRLRLDDPVDELLPELAGRRVLRDPDGPLDDTVPASRPITLRDLLTFRMGLGVVWSDSPLSRAMAEAALEPGPMSPPVTPDEWMKRLGRLPLACQPGQNFMYHTPADVMGVLMARATGQPLGDVLAGRLLAPLGMSDTAFSVPAAKLGRLPAAYRPDGDSLVLSDDPRRGRWAQPPTFPSAGGGLVSTADDLLAFGTMMLQQGRYRGRRLLARPTVQVMTTDQLTDQQREENAIFFAGMGGWGFGLNVVTRRTDVALAPGSFGWTGGMGTSFYVDPAEELIGVLLTQREMTSPVPPAVFRDFWTGAYQAIDD
ncbi:MAG TPA: serine hydrolase domain-containing protein [Streptosporangiaceae bacterium]|jgi:CubicO group peptidase (beta-lactamase class C family)|nr:serine hydrolase domain-containing protein [Streptosporangiaceae bacterium]